MWDEVAGFLDGAQLVADRYGWKGVAVGCAYLLYRHRSGVVRVVRGFRGSVREWILEPGSDPDREGDKQPCPDVDLTVRKINILVTQALHCLLNRYNACRAYVFEFEGMDDRIRPLPWLYCSCTYEVCNQTRMINCEQPNLQRIPLAAIRYWATMLGTTGAVCLHDIDEIKEKDPQSFEILADQKIQSVYCVMLADFRGLAIGFAGLDFCDGQESCLKRTEDMLDLQFEAVKIAGLLTLKRNGTLEQLAGKL